MLSLKLLFVYLFSGVIPDEYRALEMAASGTLVPGVGALSELKLPPEVITKTEGQIPNQELCTYDPKLEENDLPPYPPLPVNFDDRKLMETRRTILVLNIKSDWTPDELMDFFDRAGDVKYLRFALIDKNKKVAMIEFAEQKSVIAALKMQGVKYRSTSLDLTHSTQPIVKPEAKSNEAAQKEIEEAMSSIVKECHSQITSITDPAFVLLSSKDKGSTSRRHSRTRSRSPIIRARSRTSHTRSKRSRSRKR